MGQDRPFGICPKFSQWYIEYLWFWCDIIIIAEIVYKILKSIWFPIDFCKIEKVMEILMLDFWSLASDFWQSM